MNEGQLLLFNTLPKETPAGHCVAHNAHWVTQHDLCSYAPVEPAYIRWVSEVGVDSTSDKYVALSLLILDNVIEVGASC